MSNFKKVGKFMETFGQEVKNKAEFPKDKIVKLRYDLIAEELEEFKVFFLIPRVIDVFIQFVKISNEFVILDYVFIGIFMFLIFKF